MGVITVIMLFVSLLSNQNIIDGSLTATNSVRVKAMADIQAVAFSHDMKTVIEHIAPIHQPSTINIYRLANIKAFKYNKEHSLKEIYIQALALSPNGNVLAITTIEGVTKVWNTKTAKETMTLESGPTVYRAMMFSYDNKTLAMGNGSRLELWNVTTGKMEWSMRGHSDGITTVIWSRANSWIATVDNNGMVEVWNSKKGYIEHRLGEKTNAITSVDFAPDEKSISLGNSRGLISIWKLPRWQLKLTKQVHRKALSTLSYSRRGNILATSSEDGTVAIWDTFTGKQIAISSVAPEVIHIFLFSSDDKTLFASGDNLKAFDLSPFLGKAAEKK